MTRRRFRHTVLLTTAALLVLLWFILYTEIALRWSVSLLTDAVEPLTITEVDGRLAGPFTLHGIAYNDTAAQLSLERLTFDWKPLSLLNGTAHITRINGQGLTVTPQPPPPDAVVEADAEPPITSLPSIELPLRFIVDEVTLDNIRVNLPERPDPLTLTQLALAAETVENTLHLRHLTIESDWLSATLAGQVEPVDHYDLDLTMSWQLPQPGAASWNGQGRLHGNLLKLTLQQQLDSPFAATLSVTAKRPLKALAWEALLEVPQLQSSQLPFPLSPAFDLGGTITASGGLEKATASARIAGKVEQIGAIKANLDADYADNRVILTDLRLSKPGSPTQIQANGDIELTSPPRYRLDADWRSLGWPLAQPTVQSDQGKLTVSGDTEHYRFQSEFSLLGPQVPKSDWQLQGDGDPQAVRISSLTGRLLDGTVNGELQLDLAPQLSWRGTLQGEALNPAVLLPQWPGRLALESVFSGQLAEAGPSAEITLSSISGTLRERKVEGRAHAEWKANTAHLDALSLRIGSAKLEANGTAGEALALNWQLEAARLADLLPDAQGALKADGKLSGPSATPLVALTMRGSRLSYGELAARQLQADIALDLQADNPSSATFELARLQLPGMPEQSLKLEMEGPISAHRLRLDTRGEQQHLGLSIEAGYRDEAWSGHIGRLRIDDKQFGRWQLAQNTAFSLQPGALSVSEFCLNHDDAALCAGADWKTAEGVTAALRSARFPLQLLAPYLPRRFSIATELNGNLTLSAAPETPPRIGAALTLSQGKLRLLDPESETEVLALPFQGVDLQLDTSEQGALSATLRLTFNEVDNIVLSASTSLADGLPKAIDRHPLDARLQLSLSELAVLTNVLPELQQVEGSLNADVALTGSIASPLLKGYLKLEDGRFEIPRAGLNLTQVSLTATGDNTRQMQISGSARSGDGELAVKGELVPQEKGAWAVNATLTGERFEVANIPEARMQVSPNLTIRIVGREIHLEGDVNIPQARLEPRDLSVAVRPSGDVVIVGEEQEKAKEEKWLIHTRIRMSADESIHFIGYGFDGRIGGDLLLIDKPGSLTRGRGVLSVAAGSSYKAFGKKLTIEHGRLNFADSPVDNPNLDIRASRTIGDVVAGVNVRGTAKNPVLTLFSEPPMDQADVLSYLTLGHPVSSASQSEGEALAGAAGSAGLVGGNYLAGYLSRQFGLEEARVEARQDSQSPWLVVGKYLSPRLYIRYGVGVYEDAYSVILRYQLSKHWQIQGEGGLNSGADIIYTFERP